MDIVQRYTRSVGKKSQYYLAALVKKVAAANI
jgi:hypothetical protein